MTLLLMPGRLAIYRLSPSAAVPTWALAGGFFSATRSEDELSLVVEEKRVPLTAECEKGWQRLKVQGPLPFHLVGVLAELATPLAQAGVSIFVVSTYDTDHVLIKSDQMDTAIHALKSAGHVVLYDEANEKALPSGREGPGDGGAETTEGAAIDS